MLRNYASIYEAAAQLHKYLGVMELFKGTQISARADEADIEKYRELAEVIQAVCVEHGFDHTSDMARRALLRPPPDSKTEILTSLSDLNDSLVSELERKGIVRIPPDRKGYYDQEHLFGQDVADAFPSCSIDIQEAGNCYALGQADGCVHHLMLVLERGLNALAIEVGVPYHRTNWHPIIEAIATKLKPMPKGPQKDFYLEVNAQFGFLKDAYRNHSEHARDEHYDMPKALSILNHVRAFMQELAKGGLSE
ncbi:MAG: hypothetical protein ABIS39_01805 [Sphingomicrobium sp.]